MVQDRKSEKVRRLKPPFIKVEDQSRKFCPIFKEFERWPALDAEGDHDRVSERAMRVVEKVEKITHCGEYVLKSQLEIHRNGERHRSLTRQTGYWDNVNASISKLPSLTEFEDNCRKGKLFSAESGK